MLNSLPLPQVSKKHQIFNVYSTFISSIADSTYYAAYIILLFNLAKLKLVRPP